MRAWNRISPGPSFPVERAGTSGVQEISRADRGVRVAGEPVAGQREQVGVRVEPGDRAARQQRAQPRRTGTRPAAGVQHGHPVAQAEFGEDPALLGPAQVGLPLQPADLARETAVRPGGLVATHPGPRRSSATRAGGAG